MSYQLLSSPDTVLVLSPTLAVEGMLCTIQSFPSGSTLIRSIPAASFVADQGSGLLASLSSAVEQIIQEGTATSATGTQGVDDNGLIFDAVIFTVSYQPSYLTPAPLTATVQVPVNVLTEDTSFGSFTEGGSAADQINAAYQRLVAMSTG